MALTEQPTVLALRALGLGDLLTAVPALRALRTSLPRHRIVLATSGWLHPLVRLVEAVDAAHPAEPLRPVEWHGPPPDVAVNLHGRGPQSHRVLRLLSPRRLVAFGCPSAGVTGPYWRQDEHEVLRWCRLVEEELGTAAEPDDLHLRPPEAVPPVRRAVVVHPGAAHPARRWPVDRFATVAARLADEGHPVVLTGTAEEAGLARAVARAAGLPLQSVLAGRLTLPQLAALVADARLLVCGDTGAAHLATAFGVPSVLLFGPTPPSWWGPRSGPHRVLWHGHGPGDPFADRPDPALLRIETEEVLTAAHTLLASAPAPSVGGGGRAFSAGRRLPEPVHGAPEPLVERHPR